MFAPRLYAVSSLSWLGAASKRLTPFKNSALSLDALTCYITNYNLFASFNTLLPIISASANPSQSDLVDKWRKSARISIIQDAWTPADACVRQIPLTPLYKLPPPSQPTSRPP